MSILPSLIFLFLHGFLILLIANIGTILKLHNRDIRQAENISYKIGYVVAIGHSGWRKSPEIRPFSWNCHQSIMENKTLNFHFHNHIFAPINNKTHIE